MSLANNAGKVSFASQYPVDKIVGVWEGSFDRATDVVKRSGNLGDIYVYKIAHGLTRPVFVDLLWSDDNTTWADGGVGAGSTGEVSLAFSDSTYIYIVGSLFATATGTRYYKAIGFWIDSYDTSNPLVPSYMSARKVINFDSRVNYQKIYLQDVLTFASASTQTVVYDLSVIPNFRVFFEAFPGEVWPMNTGGASNPYFYHSTQNECSALTTLASLQVTMDHVPAPSRAWYRIYLDTV
jgi:hypothetical protein